MIACYYRLSILSVSYIVSFIGFFAIIFIVLFGSHIFLYFALRHFFNPDDIAKRIIIIAIGFLSVSFIAVSFLAHWQDTFFVRILYYCSAIWLGILSNAFFVFLVLWISSSIFSFLRFPVSLLKIGWLGVGATVLVSLYGIVNATIPVIREDIVYVRNLPASWEGKKIIQMNDIHLGHIFRADFTRRIADTVKTANPAAIFIVGDLFDGMDGELD